MLGMGIALHTRNFKIRWAHSSKVFLILVGWAR